MKFLELISGLIMLVYGLFCLYKPDRIMKFNMWVREQMFSDQLLVSHRKKIGVMLVICGLILLYAWII
jgi:hypothetical protein